MKVSLSGRAAPASGLGAVLIKLVGNSGSARVPWKGANLARNSCADGAMRG